MRESYHKYLKNDKLPNSAVAFLSGLFFGIAITYIVVQINWEIEIPEKAANDIIVNPILDPLEKFDFPVNNRITAKIKQHLRPGRKSDFIKRYKRSGNYLPMIQAIFDEYNLPQFLVYLPIIESGFIPESRSKAGAAGLWQLMPATASDYGLKYSRWIDERRDPEKSTIVAAEFLQFLYDKLKNWDLVLAAYNCGYGVLKRAIRHEKTADYWLLKRIPKETYHFVPKYYAVLHLIAHPEKYNLKLPKISRPIDYETIDLEATFTIEQIAKLANVSPGVIKAYNPALISSIAPSGKYTVKVPVGVKEHFIEQYKDKHPDQIEFTYSTYRVRKGDSLYKIARKFGTTIQAITADNNLRSSRLIKVGQILKVASIAVVEEAQATTEDTKNISEDTKSGHKTNQIKYIYKVKRNFLSINTIARYYAVTGDELKSWNPWIQSDKIQKGEEIIIYKLANEITLYKIRRGDSLWRLARKYNTTVRNLKRWNQIYSSRIHPGQRLIVKMI